MNVGLAESSSSGMAVQQQFKYLLQSETCPGFISHMSESTFYSKSSLIAIC